MKILQRYIGSTVLASIGIIFLAFLGLEIFISFVTELSMIGKGDYGLTSAFEYVLRLTPNQLYEIFPVIGLLGSLIGLGVLSSHNELTVVRAAGVSIIAISKIVLRVAAVVLVLATLMGEVIGPMLQYDGDKIKEMALSGGQALATGDTVWLRAGDSFIQIGEVVGSRQLKNVTEWKMNEDHQLQQQRLARVVNYENDHWVMFDIAETTFNGNDRVQSRHVKSAVWPIDLRPELFVLGLNEPQAMNLIKLWNYIQYRKDSGLQASSYQLSFWKRLYQPLATLVMIFLAIPFVFFGSNRSMTMGLRIIIGIMMGLGFFIFNELLGQFSIVFRIPAPLAALLPILLFAVIGCWLVKRAH